MPDFTISKRRFHFITAPLRRLAPQFVPAEPHCRKFSFMTHLWLSLAAQLLKIDSANTLLEELNDVTGPHAQRNLRQLVGFDFTDSETLQPVQLNQSSSGTLWVELIKATATASGGSVGKPSCLTPANTVSRSI